MFRVLKLLCFPLVLVLVGCATVPQGTRLPQEEVSTSNRFARLLASSPAMPGREAPDAALFDLNGGSVQLKQVLEYSDKREGKKPTVLLFSSTACPYSVQEHLEVETAMKSLGKSAKAVTILVNETPESGREYANRNRVPGTVLVDPESKAAKIYKIELVPTILLVNTKGYVNHFGHYTQARDVVSLMTKLHREDESSGSGGSARRG